MKKIFKILKIILTLLFIGVSIFILLYALNQNNLISLDFSFFTDSDIGKKLTNIQLEHPKYFDMTFYGIVGLTSWISLGIIISMIPFVKTIFKVVKKLFGWLIVTACVILIVIGIIGMLGIFG